MKKHKRKRLGEEYIINQRKKAILGIMDILILQWVRKTPLCGQDVMDKIKAEFSICIGPGTMYPILFNLRDKKLIRSTIIDKKKLYHLTPKGKTQSKSLSSEYLKIQKEVGSFFRK